MIIAMVFVIGAVVGSFLNVCIHRMPSGESIVTPRSHCTTCGKTIGWFDNIPLLSYVVLFGKCHSCKAPISPRYFIVELLNALLYVLLFAFYGLTAKFFIFASVTSALIVISFIDLKIQEIPDEISLPGIVIGLTLCAIFPGLMAQERHLYGLFYSFIGMLAGGGVIFMMGFIGKLIFKKDAMGGGDVKLMAALGAFLGWKYIILTFFLAPFSGSIIGVIQKFRNNEDTIPYGPHLSIASIIALLWGNTILSWIFHI